MGKNCVVIAGPTAKCELRHDHVKCVTKLIQREGGHFAMKLTQCFAYSE